MKKILLLFTILFALTASACQSDSYQHPSSSPEHILSKPEGNNVPLLGFSNYEAYKNFVDYGISPYGESSYFPKTFQPLPSDFIPYEKLSALGEFEVLVFLCEARQGDYSRYFYSFRDENGFKYGLEIYHDGGISYNTTLKDREQDVTVISNAHANNITDLRTIQKSQTDRIQFVQIKNITYCYLPSGKLMNISWAENGISFGLSSTAATEYEPSGYFSEYPMDGKNTFIKQLLTAPRTPAEIQQMCSSTLEKE